MTRLQKYLGVIALLLVITVLAGLYAAKLIRQGAEAYLFGYPLVLMGLTRSGMAGDANPERGSNHLYHMRFFPDHSFKNVVRPNNDTLYSISWFDLQQQPMIISVPAIDRYYVLPFMDAWTNVFASIGTRNTGPVAGDYALVGPDWSGTLPEGVEKLQAPTNMVWLIARIRIDSKDDIAAVAAIQEQLSITPLSQWAERRPYPATVIDPSKLSRKSNPKAQLDAMDTETFFNRLSYLMDSQPPAQTDFEAVDNLANFNIFPGQEFKLQQIPSLQRTFLETGMRMANQKLHEATESRKNSPQENGWIVWRDTIGNYGNNYRVRAGIALAALAAMAPREAVYPTTFVDSAGDFLTGAHSYRIHFPSAPPNNAFWSLTLYDVDGFLVENPIRRFTLGSRDALDYHPDGSFDIVIGHQQPAGPVANWLPAPSGEFSLTLRIYLPAQAFLDGSWQMPAVEKID